MAIHTIDYDVTTGLPVEQGLPILFDLSSELTLQTNRLWRQAANYKVSKIRIAADLKDVADTYVQASGVVRFLKPTSGRIAALKKARNAWLQACRNAGSHSKFHDFRITPQGKTNYANLASGLNGTYPSFKNLSTLDGSNALAMFNNSATGYEIFTTHNNSLPTRNITATNMFTTGLTTRLDASAGSNDMVLDEEVLLPNHPFAATTDYSEIPFVLSYDEQNNVHMSEITPSPNQYYSFLMGMFEIQFDGIDTTTDGEGNIFDDEFQLKISVDVLGCKMWTTKRKSTYRPRFNKRKVRKAKKIVKGAYRAYRFYKRR